MKRVIVTALVVLAILVVVAGGFTAWLIGTAGGAAFVMRKAILPAAPGLSVAATSGSLHGSLVLGGLRFESGQFEVTAASAVLQIDLARLIEGRLVFRDVRVSAVNARVSSTAPSVDTAASPAVRVPAAIDAPDLPLDVVLDSGVIDGLVLTMDGKVTELGRMTLGGSYSKNDLEIVRLESEWRGFTFSLQARLAFGSPVGVDATISAVGPVGQNELVGSVRLNGELPTLAIDAELIEPLAATAVGSIGLEPEPGIELTVEWEPPDADLVDLSRFAYFSLGAGSGTLAGDFEAADFSVDSAITIRGESIDVAAEGRYAEAAIALEALSLTRGEAVLAASGRVDPAARTYVLSLTGRALDPAVFLADWGGRLEATGDVEGAFGDVLTVSSPALELSGVLRGHEFDATLAGAYRGTADIEVERARLRIGDNELELTGRIADELDLDVDTALLDLGQLHDALSGSVQAQYVVSGPRTSPSFDGFIEAADIAVGDSRAESLLVSGSAGLRPDSPVNLTVSAIGPAYRNAALQSLDSAITGTATAHSIEFSAAVEDWRAAGTVRGSLADGLAWSGTLATLGLEREPFGEWNLREEARLAIDSESLNLESACLVQDEAEICSALDVDGGQMREFRVDATAFDIGLLGPFLPPALDARGRYDFAIALEGALADPVGSVRASGRNTSLVFSLADGETVDVELTSAELDGAIDEQGYQVSIDVAGTGTDRINARLEGVRLNDRDTPVTGSLHADWSEVGGLSLLSPNVGAVLGRITADVTVGGSIAAPQFDGQAAIMNGSVELPEWGVVAEEITAMATSPDGRALQFDATGSIDGNELRLSGTTMLEAAAGWPTRLRLTGDAVEVVQIADADIVVSPNLEIMIDLPNIAVSGTVVVPSALIAVEELPSQAVRPSADAVIHGAAAEERAAPIVLSAEIDLQLGDDVHYEGAGLTADLTGGLNLRYSTITSTAASGSLSVAGIYEAFGQELTLERGELVFTGPLDDPTLDIRAVRQIDTIRVGIDLTGTLKAPVSRIFSEPAMAEADAVSYLLFGRPLAAPDGSDPDQLRNAAVSLGLRQAVPVIQRIGDTMGLDEFAIESTDVDAGELMAGKFLSPRLYVRYSYGLFNRIGGLLVRYRLNERLSIETRSGDQKSMDLLLEVERD